MGIQKDMIGQQVTDIDNYKSTFLFIDYFHDYGNRAYQERALWSPARTPPFVDLIEGNYYQLVNLQTFAHLANTTIAELTYKTLII